jgi:hypothetical protein
MTNWPRPGRAAWRRGGLANPARSRRHKRESLAVAKTGRAASPLAEADVL